MPQRDKGTLSTRQFRNIIPTQPYVDLEYPWHGLLGDFQTIDSPTRRAIQHPKSAFCSQWVEGEFGQAWFCKRRILSLWQVRDRFRDKIRSYSVLNNCQIWSFSAEILLLLRDVESIQEVNQTQIGPMGVEYVVAGVPCYIWSVVTFVSDFDCWRWWFGRSEMTLLDEYTVSNRIALTQGKTGSTVNIPAFQSLFEYVLREYSQQSLTVCSTTKGPNQNRYSAGRSCMPYRPMSNHVDQPIFSWW